MENFHISVGSVLSTGQARAKAQEKVMTYTGLSDTCAVGFASSQLYLRSSLSILLQSASLVPLVTATATQFYHCENPGERRDRTWGNATRYLSGRPN